MKTKEIMHKNDRNTAIVVYNQFDMGCKYHVYTIRDGIKRYSASFNNIVSAVNYCDRIY